MKKVNVILTGGTISCERIPGGGFKRLDLTDFLYSFDEVKSVAEIKVINLMAIAGREMRFNDMFSIVQECKRSIEEDNVDGIVVITGTNIMEEVSFAANILLQTDVPIVFTGAMRLAQTASADGAGNCISAIRVAASENCRGLGVLVVMNEVIHSAKYVRKEHSTNVAAFKSDFPLGYISEGKPSIRCMPVNRPLPKLDIKRDADVFLYSTFFSDSGVILDKIEELGYQGLVLEGTGGGGVPGWVADKMIDLATRIPVVLSARVGHGDVIVDSYGYSRGNGSYFKAHGGIISGMLDGRKSRILLTLMLMAECEIEEIKEAFEVFSPDYIL